MVGSVAFSPDGLSLATVSYPQSRRPHAELRVWDLATGRERRSDRLEFGAALTRVDGGERLVLEEENGDARSLAEFVPWPRRLLLEALGAGVYCRSALSRDGRFLATARHRADRDRDTRVRIWDVESGRLVKTLDDSELVDMLTFSPDGRTLAGARERLAAWDVESGDVLVWSKTAAGCVAPLAIAPDDSALAVQAHGSKLNVIDPADGRVRASFNYVQADALAFSPGGRRLAVADDSRVDVWDLGSQKRIVSFEGHVRPFVVEHAKEMSNHIKMLARQAGLKVAYSTGNAVWSSAFSPDGRFVASCDLDGTARVWGAATGTERFRFNHQINAPSWLIAASWSWAIVCVVVALNVGRRTAHRGHHRDPVR